MSTIDLRSDTVTKPSLAMRDVMQQAEVGDDIYREDPTVLELEKYCANITGKEASLFVPSGTMGNLIPILIFANRGSEIILHESGHSQILEQSGMSAFAGAKPVIVSNEKGILPANEVKNKINIGTPYYAEKTSLIIIENTHNYCGGTYWNENELSDLAKVSKAYNLPIHMDGARIFNAHIASGLAIDKIASYATSLTFCLSKGLGAPVGSMLCGDKDFINSAMTWRKRLGGAMRQSGILAAAGLYALKNNVNRLVEDHANTKKIYHALKETTWAKVDTNEPVTNILFANTIDTAPSIVTKLKEKGVLVNASHPHKIRFVCHLDISTEQIDKVCKIIKEL